MESQPDNQPSAESDAISSISPNSSIQERQPPVYFNSQISPIWTDSGSMWYQREIGNNLIEYWSVDLNSGVHQRAFDPQELSTALQQQGLTLDEPQRPAIELLHILPQAAGFEFLAGGRFWRWSSAERAVSELESAPTDSNRWLPALSLRAARRGNRQGGPETHLIFVNRSDRDVELFWSSGPNQQTSYGKLAAGDTRSQHTFSGHVWLVSESGKSPVAGFQATSQAGMVLIDNRLLDQPPESSEPAGRRGANRNPAQSPDGKWRVEVREHNLWLVNQENQEAVAWSADGDAQRSYSSWQWSPDSQSLIAFRVTAVDRKSVHLIESSPDGGGRARLRTLNYDLPGDPFPEFELNLFQVTDRKQLKPETDSINFGWPDVKWSDDSSVATFRQVDRGHQRFRIVEVRASDGRVRNLVDQRSQTFIWTAHGDRPLVRELSSGDFIFGSEHDGYHHLYFVDRQLGGIRNAITSGPFVVRSVQRIDESNQQIWFEASGVYPDQDPYLIHWGRVNFDGSGLTWLTQGNGAHSVQLDPTGEFALVTWSRVDHPPVHELRRWSDGQLITELVRSQPAVSDQAAAPLPEVFSATGRDGQTSIWGIICRPHPFDPNRKYPVIEDIYAGPHDSHVPKNFSPQPRYRDLTDLGFIVVKIDGMGTANRSKTFHDVCWQNLKDAGFPDRILWHQAVAAKYPSYDAERVGIFGTSAGGQNAAGAVLFHGDFYRAAAASCGCHDNRMDKASWNEQWMGYPVGPHYAASSNIDNASKLSGKLFLLVGELDTNVPPESTLRFVDALVKADKDFEFLLIPGLGHSDGGPYGRRRIREFFVKHLQPDLVRAVVGRSEE